MDSLVGLALLAEQDIADGDVQHDTCYRRRTLVAVLVDSRGVLVRALLAVGAYPQRAAWPSCSHARCLALELLCTERYAQVGERSFERGLGLFAGLNVLPK